jgi:hypothetical protein
MIHLGVPRGTVIALLAALVLGGFLGVRNFPRTRHVTRTVTVTKKAPVASYITSLQYARIKQDLRNAAERSAQAAGGDVSRISLAPTRGGAILVTYFFFCAGLEAPGWEEVRISSGGSEKTLHVFIPAAAGVPADCESYNGQPTFKP